MARFVFKLRGLGTDPDIIRVYTLPDAATTRALDRLRITPETNEQVMVRLWNAFMDENIVRADYLARKDPALAEAAAGVTKAVPTVETTET